MRYALFLPIFDELADPRVVATLAAQAEEHGWDGLFVWDHVAYAEPVRAIADPWLCLAAAAVTTERVRLGPMVTPLPRRRPVVVARQTASLDLLSNGRLVLGVGIGGDSAGEFSGVGDEADPRRRGRMLDEHLALLAAAWTGEPVHHHGEHYRWTLPGFAPTPVQRPGPPVWVAARYGNPAPLRRAARHDGVFPIQIDSPDQLAEVVATVRELRAVEPAPDRPTGFEVAVSGPVERDPGPYAEAGATWWLTSFSPYGIRADAVRAVVCGGPPR